MSVKGIYHSMYLVLCIYMHRFSLPADRLILHRLLALLGSATMAPLQWLCYNDAIISRLQGVPAKHLRLVQLLRIRLRQVTLRYRVA